MSKLRSILAFLLDGGISPSVYSKRLHKSLPVLQRSGQVKMVIKGRDHFISFFFCNNQRDISMRDLHGLQPGIECGFYTFSSRQKFVISEESYSRNNSNVFVNAVFDPILEMSYDETQSISVFYVCADSEIDVTDVVPRDIFITLGLSCISSKKVMEDVVNSFRFGRVSVQNGLLNDSLGDGTKSWVFFRPSSSVIKPFQFNHCVKSHVPFRRLIRITNEAFENDVSASLYISETVAFDVSDFSGSELRLDMCLLDCDDLLENAVVLSASNINILSSLPAGISFGFLPMVNHLLVKSEAERIEVKPGRTEEFRDIIVNEHELPCWIDDEPLAIFPESKDLILSGDTPFLSRVALILVLSSLLSMRRKIVVITDADPQVEGQLSLLLGEKGPQDLRTIPESIRYQLLSRSEGLVSYVRITSDSDFRDLLAAVKDQRAFQNACFFVPARFVSGEASSVLDGVTQDIKAYGGVQYQSLSIPGFSMLHLIEERNELQENRRDGSVRFFSGTYDEKNLRLPASRFCCLLANATANDCESLAGVYSQGWDVIASAARIIGYNS